MIVSHTQLRESDKVDMSSQGNSTAQKYLDDMQHCTRTTPPPPTFVPLQHTGIVAAVDCKEDYQAMDIALRDIFTEINELNNNGKMEVDGKNVDVELFAGGDMKVSPTPPTPIPLTSLSLTHSLSHTHTHTHGHLTSCYRKSTMIQNLPFLLPCCFFSGSASIKQMLTTPAYGAKSINISGKLNFK